VDGTAIPEVPFDIGESYAGLLPISSDPEDDRTLYFWYFPSLNPNATTEVAVWLNGGPGCSSLSGLLTENGPFTWMEGTLAPVQNPYSWHNLTNMIWIEQPVGVGYTTGVPSISDEEDLGKQFVGFWKNFVDTFTMQDFSVYLSGESYAGFYVPYIADAFIQENDTEYYDLKGIAINNPIIGDDTTQGQVTVLPYAHAFNDIFYLNDTFLHAMDNYNSYCNYTSYMRKYLTFPSPQEPFPVLPDPYQSDDYECDVFDYVYAAVLEINPCFNIYHITETCPHTYSELGIVNEGDYHPPGAEIYFNRTDVKRAINAPENSNWLQCTDVNVFANKPNRTGDYSAGHDTSPGPATNGVLQRVIEHTNNVIIGSGNLDFLLNTNGTLLAIQNMTWSGHQGLRSYPGKPFNVPYHKEYNGGALAGAGKLGTWGEERGLTFYQVQLAGHELPGYAAGAGYRVLEKLLGRIGDLGERSGFSTQRGERQRAGHVEMQAMLHEQKLRPNIDPRKQRLINARSGGREEL
jgi:carboxypeptidase D